MDDVAGTTRDAINISWSYKGRRVNLVDTAGIEKGINHRSDVERKCHKETIRAVKYS